jgi:hypothetical protein
MLFFILLFIWQPFPLYMVVNRVVFTMNYKAQENKASKKIFEVRKNWNFLSTKSEAMQQLYTWYWSKKNLWEESKHKEWSYEILWKEKKSVKNMKKKWNHYISYNLFNKICKHLLVVVNAMHVVPWVILKASKISTLVGMVFKH